MGLGVVAVVGLWLATRPSLTPQARIQRLHNTKTAKESNVKPNASAVSRNREPESTSNTPNTNTPGDRNNILPSADKRENLLPQASQDIPQGPIEATPAVQEPRESLPQSVVPEQIEPIKTERFYIVQKNDTLSSISQKYYGTPTKWPKIFNANRTTISDANRLTIGTKLIIPDESD